MEAYKRAGVDVEAGYKAVELMKKHVKSTMRDDVLSNLGGFSGLFSLAKFKDMEEPCLVSGTDGVGTKLKLAFMCDKHDTIGIDVVAMCVNDIICCGAEPLFYLDYIACGKNEPEKIAEIVKGIAHGCKQSNAALIGGETAEMPGFYPEDEYDVAGFTVGIVDKKRVIDGKDMAEGDVIIGLASSGVHSNGFSLVRMILNEQELDIHANYEGLEKSLGETLLEPTKIYVEPLLKLHNQLNIKAVSHITGGGFYENIPRMMKEGLTAHIDKGSWEVLPIFNFLGKQAGLTEKDLYGTFNMGVGMAIVVSEEEADQAMALLEESGEKAYKIGRIAKGEEGIVLC